MNKRIFLTSGLIVLLALMTHYQTVFAHEAVTAGDYELEIGWVTEPPIVGQQNAIVVNISNTSAGETAPVEDVLELTVMVSYGGQTKMLTLQPLGEDTPGQFVAPILPTVPGLYTIVLGGKLGDTDVKAEVNPEEVQPAAMLQFPSVESAQKSAGKDWLVWLGALLGLIGIGLGVTALRKAR